MPFLVVFASIPRLLQTVPYVQMYDFALLEAAEYLDGHPNNADALDYFKKQQALYRAAADAYTKKYGPLQYKTGNYESVWSWSDDPWPWEGAEQ